MKGDKTLLDRLRLSDERAYMQLFDEYFKRLHRFAAGIVYDSDTAHDIVQSVFVALYEKAPKLPAATNLGGWLFSSVRNACLNYLRDRKVEDRRKLLYVQATLNADALEWLDDEKLIAKIHQTIAELPDKCREVAEMRLLHCMKFSEIADRLSISENTAKVQAHRAVQKIKESIVSDPTLAVAAALFLETFL